MMDSEISAAPLPPAGEAEAADRGDAPARDSIPAGLIARLGKTSHKQSQELTRLRRSFERLGKLEADNEHWRALRDLLDKNRQYQQELGQRVEEQLVALKAALADGRSKDALSLWDRIQGNLRQCTGKLHNTLQKEANSSKGELLELRKWRNFAATEKKKELIGEIGNLAGADLPPAELSRQIQQLHDRWKALGRSEQNEKLWRQFKKISDEVYAPCKEYFRERKQRMALNLKARAELCEQLEQKLAELEAEKTPIHIIKLNQAITECNAAWKKHAPVEQSKIKPLQKRYYAALKQLTALRKDAVAQNAAGKQSLLDRAGQLAAAEDSSGAAAEIRKLQAEWKKIGPTDFREEKRLREAFQAACEAVGEAERAAREKARERNKSPAEKRHDGQLAALAPQTGFLEKSEASLFQADDEAGFGERHRAIDTGEWEQLTANATDDDDPGDSELDDRLQALLAVGSLAELVAQAEDCEQQQRRALVGLEIEAGVNSPREDQSARMELQLQQLASGFGKRAPDSKQLAAKLREAELALLRAGPLSPKMRKNLRERLAKLRQRLSSRPPRSRGD
ncbi:MAG: DUF349 domain-containing protein [Gammaproteobacteria bacterium]|nr:DUF349 domain-containing protein [Gammaproteobacteria bacterium]